MAVYDKFLVGYNDNNSGYQTNVKPWLINDSAFQDLEDVYIFRGRVKKRFGSMWTGSSQLDSRLRLDTGASYSMSQYTGTVPGVVFAVGQMFSVDNDMFTVTTTGTPGTMLATNGATSGTFNTTTGEFTITGYGSGKTVYFYPATPVMGLPLYYNEQSNVYTSLAFDTQFSYFYDIGSNSWQQITSGASTWTGDDYDFFWTAAYQGASNDLNSLWATNFHAADGIRYYNGSTWTQPVLNWTQGSSLGTTDGSGNASGTVPGSSGFIGQVFNIGTTQFLVTASSGALTPSSNYTAGPTGTGTFDISTGAYTFSGATANVPIYFTGNNYIQTCQIIVQFKNRLVLLNTVEMVDGSSEKFPYRCRFSAIGSPFTPDAWMQDVPGNGGAIDAPTEQQIITAQFVKDRLIVYFSSSTYELVYTGNQVLPFVWQKINNELGAVSPFSEVPFDKFTIGIDDTGIHACNGSNVDRVDVKIPQYPFSNISNEEHGQDRVNGIRDFNNEMAYWTVPTTDRNNSFYFPNQVLVYNYINESWATINDTFTSWGYFYLQPQFPGLTWGETYIPWGNNTNYWNNGGNNYINTTIKSVIAGNQQGFVQVLQPDLSSNAPSMQVSGFSSSSAGSATISCINHNLTLNDFVLLENMNGLTFTDSQGNVLPSIMCRVTPDPVVSNTPNSFSISTLDNFSQGITIAGTYIGGGTVRRVSNVNILTKQYNFYTEQDRNMYLARIDFMVDRTVNGQVTVNYLVGSSPIYLASDGLGSLISPGPLPGNSVLETSPYVLSNFEQFQDRLWHPIYAWGDGQCVQLSIYMSPNQMFSYAVNNNGTLQYVALNDFEMHAMLFYVTSTSSRMTAY